MRAHLRCLCNDRRIDIFDKHMILFQQFAHFFQQFYGRNTLVCWICIREMFPDVPQRRCSQQRIHDRMEQDIRIRMSQKSLFIRYFHAADDEVSSLHQTVYVISHSDSHTYNLSADVILFQKVPTVPLRPVPGANIVRNIRNLCHYYLATAQFISSSVLSNT